MGICQTLTFCLSLGLAAQSPLAEPFKYAHEPRPTAANDVAVASRGATARTDSNPPRYHPLPLIDGDTWDRYGHVYTAWNSGDSATPHWAEVTFARPETVDRVTLHWPVVNGVMHASARYTIEAWVTGAWRQIAKQDGVQTDPATTHRFEPLRTPRIRISQPVGGGHAKTPNVMWMREIEVTAVGAVAPVAVPSNLLKGLIRCQREPESVPGNRTLKTEGASFIPGCKVVALVSSRSGIAGKFRIYITYEAKHESSVQRNVGPLSPGSKARVIFDLPESDGVVKVVHLGWMKEGGPNEDLTVEEVRVVTEAEPPALWAIRDKALPWRTPAINATDVPLDTSVTLFFGDQIWPGSLTGEHFKLICTDGEVPCLITYEPWMRKVILRPKEKLKPNTTYLVGMGCGVRDLRGNRLHNRPGELDGHFFSTGDRAELHPQLVKLLGTGGIQAVEWPADLRVGWPGRVVVEVPSGTGKLEVTTSEQLKLVDRTPFDPSLGLRKFYFVATRKSGVSRPASASVTFHTPEGARASVTSPIVTLADEFAARRAGALDLPRRWPVGKAVTDRKKESISHPAEKIKAARWEWIKDGSRDKPDFPSNEQLYQLVPPTWMQRNVYVNEYQGCPVHGTEVHKFRGVGTWRLDPTNRPFQIQCRVGGEWYPTNKIAENDFTSGEFPDDGFGCWHNGICYHFIGYYTHTLFTSLGNWYGWTASGVRHFTRTGEQVGARKAMILLYRLAEEYAHLAAKPADRMNSTRGTTHRHDTPARRSHLRQVHSESELRVLGMFRDNIWTCACFQATCQLYDAIFSGLQEEDRELIDFLHLKSPAINTMADIRRFFEENFIRVGVQAILDSSVRGNEGAHQEAMMTAALVSDIPKASEVVDWVFTGEGQYRYKLANSFFKDGAAFESVSYNSRHVAKLHNVYGLLARLQELYPERYPASKYPFVTMHPKYQAILKFPVEMCMLDGAVAPSIGDAGLPQDNGVLPPRPGGKMGGQRHVYESMFRSTRDPLFAQIVYGSGDPRDKDRDRKRLLYDDPELNKAVDEAIAKHGTRPVFSSRLFDGYGLAVLRSGEGTDRRAAWMSWSRLRGHPHRDLLQIGYCGKQRNVMRCLGYPRAMGCKCRGAWEYNQFTHFRPYIWPDSTGYGTGQYREFSSVVRPRHFVHGTPIQVVDAGGPGPESVRDERGLYTALSPPISRRTAVLIDVSPTDSYVLDIVRLKGGRRHYLTVPGIPMHRTVKTDGLELVRQAKGTLAGEDIDHWDFEKAKARYQSHYLNGAAAFHNVSWAEVTEAWWIDWELKADVPSGLHLRYRQIPLAPSRVALADGDPHHPRENDYHFRTAFTIREGDDPLTSQFVGTYEFHKESPIVDDLQRLELRADKPSVFAPVALRVKAGPQEDIIISTDGYAPQRVAGDGFTLDGEYGVVSRRDHKLNAAVLVNGIELRSGNFQIRQKRARHDARIVAVDYPRYTVTISPAPLVPRALIGEYVLVRSRKRQAALRVVAVGPGKEEDSCSLRFEFDPLIGEGVAESFADHQITTGQTFFLAGAHYYEDAALTDESGQSAFRLLEATREGTLLIDSGQHPDARAAGLAERFVDGPDDGRDRNLFIYDYGVGDNVTCFLPVRLARTANDTFSVRAHQPIELTLPRKDAPGAAQVEYRLLPEGQWRRAEYRIGEESLTCNISFDASADGKAELRFVAADSK